jgi:uncharacterized protein involved in response to NO
LTQIKGTPRAARYGVSMNQTAVPRFNLFEYGFRPFFLLAGLHALAFVPAWLFFLSHGGGTFGSLPLMYWHAHEMVYGFVLAAVAGFMLTAVPSWTGARGFRGAPLIGLVMLWLAGRVAVSNVGVLPFWVVAAAELSLLPALAALLMPPLLRNRNRNLMLLVILAVLWLIDLAFVLALRRGDAVLASRAMTLAIDCIAILVTVIGGRIVPAFTGNGLRRRGIEPQIASRGWLEKTVIGLMIAIAISDVLQTGPWVGGVLAALAAAAHVLRLAGWRSFRTGHESILWVLHVGYAWLPIALALKACWLLGDAAFASKWQHALTMGAFATMILAVMTRASLGHTGRPLVVSPAITLAYLSLTAGVIARVFGAALAPDHYIWTLTLAGAAWTLAFLLFVIVYAPILAGPRADGKAG